MVTGYEVNRDLVYRDEIYSLQILLSRTHAGPGRTVKHEQEETSPNHVQRKNLISVDLRGVEIREGRFVLEQMYVGFYCIATKIVAMTNVARINNSPVVDSLEALRPPVAVVARDEGVPQVDEEPGHVGNVAQAVHRLCQ